MDVVSSPLPPPPSPRSPIYTTPTGMLKEHGPVAVLVTSMLLMGGLINSSPSSFPAPEAAWCEPRPQALLSMQTLPPGLEPTVLALSALVPILPLMIHPATAVNIEVFKAHVAGQTACFGLAELVRHYSTASPNVDFLKICNVSSQECSSRVESSSRLISANETESLCKRSDDDRGSTTASPVVLGHLFDSLYPVPKSAGAQLGSAIVTLLAILFYWHRLSSDDKSPYETQPWLKIFLISLQCVLLIALSLYCYCLYVTLDPIQIFGVLFGAFLQIFIVVSMLRQM